MPTSTLILLIAILIVGIFVFIAISTTGRRAHNFDVEEYQTRFLKIENSLTRENKLSYNVSVIEADKLLDRAQWNLACLVRLWANGSRLPVVVSRSSTRFGMPISSVIKLHTNKILV